jgi:hypothetical protein
VVRSKTGSLCFPNWVGTEEYPVDHNAMRGVEVKLDYRYASTTGCVEPVLEIQAEVLTEKGKWERRYSGGIAFTLRNFVEKRSS